MIKKLNKWLRQRFLPTWVKDTLLKENDTLRARVALLEHEIKEYEAYVAGMEFAISRRNRIYIHNHFKDKGGEGEQ